MSSTRGYAAALGLLVVCGLGGCTGGGDDPPASSSTGATGATRATGATGGVGSAGSATTTTPSSSTTTAGPATTTVQIPTAARAHTAAGAEAYLRFFMDQVSKAWTTPQTGLIRDLGLPDCLACRSFEATAANLVSKGYRYERRPSTTVSTTAVVDGTGQRVHTVIQQHEVNIVDRQGNVVSTDRRRTFAGDAKLVWEGGRWWLFDMG